MDIGIDLGTTFSVIAVNGKVDLVPEYPAGIYLAECDVTIIPTPDGESTFPSVMIDDPDRPDEYLFGRDALQQAQEGLVPVMFSKRRIGTKEPINLKSSTITAKDVARHFLRYLKQCAERSLGESVSRAVVTHPAYFDRGAVEETREAAREAGFDMTLTEQLLMEPVAAALAYARTDQRDPLKILTYDLGGGTFDVTYLERSAGVISMRSFDGDHLLGGYNFDRELVNWLLHRLKSQGRRLHIDEASAIDRGRLARLLQIAEGVKISLAKAAKDVMPVDFRVRDVLIDVDGKPLQANERITRNQFVEIIQPYLSRTIDCCKRALEKAGVKIEDVHEILLVGGSSYGPWVPSSLATAFSQAKPRLFHPDLCVGAGAAIQCKIALPNRVTSRSISLTLDVPDRTSLSVVNITGKFHREGLPPDVRDVSVKLSTPVDGEVGPTKLDADGSFLFPDVNLFEEDSNSLTLTLLKPDGAELFLHKFLVVHTLQAGDTSTVTTVLPKPLYVETLDGLVPIAKEGEPLPAKIHARFARVNNNPSIELRLIQDGEPTGTVRLENIPPNCGKGCHVNMEVVVTSSNWIQGKAFIENADSKVVYQAPVKIQFLVAPVPTREALQEDLTRWRSRPDAATAEGQMSEVVRVKAAELLAEAERLLGQVPLERQEVQAKLIALKALLTPPSDFFQPSQAEVTDLIQDCHRLVRRLVAGDRDGAAQKTTDAIDAKMRVQLDQRHERVKRMEEAVQRLEERAASALQARDYRSWSQVFEDLCRLKASLDQSGSRDLPTFLIKLHLHARLMALMERLAIRLEEIDRRGRLRDWQNEIVDIRDAVQLLDQKLNAIPDDLSEQQGLARLQQVLRDAHYEALEKRVNSIGAADVAKA